ncbi:DUF6895 family protein [Embleya hyalina]|uniref:DUF6895 domain-containing protein n=1 Tax=Embleya hyalina TaxID=516124 RepID=A0A401YVJ7_9ACTN|nr:hypothetical protein [Embleya hyalina]GCD98642.1 hypothetical protein EHYA_06353 [Embleya hyalina]
MNADVLKTAHTIGSRALRWLHDNADFGTLPTHTVVDFNDRDGAYKPLGEAALATSLMLRERVAGPGDLAIARDLIDFAWGQFQSGNFLYERQVRHPLITDPLETYAHFTRAGLRHEQMDRLQEHLAELRSVHGIELMPNRRLAVANASRVAGVSRRFDWAALAADTWLGMTPEPWVIDWMTAYCMTHTVFHVTDWGAHPELLPADIRDYLRIWLPVWVDIWAEVAQFDLVGELLAVDACLPEPVCDAQGWQRLAAAQREDGLLPRDADPIDEDPKQAFKDHEHTAVVAIVAGTITLARSLGTTTVSVPA